MAQAGIKLEIIPGDGKQTLTKYRARQHDIYIGIWGPDYQDPNTNAQTFASNPDNSDDAKVEDACLAQCLGIRTLRQGPKRRCWSRTPRSVPRCTRRCRRRSSTRARS